MRFPRRSNLRRPRGPARARLAPSFTLTELLVAVGIVAVLSIAIGEIFRTVSKIVSSGSAIAEIDQMARAIEKQLRDDFEGFNAMRPEETYLVIRCREIGDTSRNANLSPGETAIYLTQDDRDADLREGILPYQESSLAVTRRLDEMVFLARSAEAEGFQSNQFDRRKPGGDPDAELVRKVSTPVARIYWGHALKPRLDPDYDPETDAAPRRFYWPDASAPSTDRTAWGAFFGLPGRNEFASEWILARHPLLLFGGAAAGYSEDAGRSIAPIGNGREFAPYIRDLENILCFDSNPNLMDLWASRREMMNDDDIVDDLFIAVAPEERLLCWGRVDICAQDAEDVRRWLEGEPPGWQPGMIPTARPFATGAYIDPEYDSTLGSNGPGGVNGPLWVRAALGPNPPYGAATPNGFNPMEPVDVQRYNLGRLRSALAGTLVRPLADTLPPLIDRNPTGPGAHLRQPEDALMDVHAAMAAHCSSFEIAWSDGSTANRDIDVNGDGIFEFRAGDLIFCDIRPTVESATGAAEWRASFDFLSGLLPTGRIRRGDINTAQYNLRFSEDDTPANIWDLWARLPDHYPEVTQLRRSPGRDGLAIFEANVNPSGDANNPGDAFFDAGKYHPWLTGGDPAPLNTAQEYLAIWGFRIPDSNGEYSLPWPKDLFIRVRVTLHDAQRRIPGGKTYEFIFRANPEGL